VVALAACGHPTAASLDGPTGGMDGQSGRDSGASDASIDAPTSPAGDFTAQQAYLKASDTSTLAQFGGSIAISADGSTLAVGAKHTGSDAGAAYVFTRVGGTWTQQARLTASNGDAGDLFGVSVAISGDGSTTAVGAQGEASAASGIGGNQSDNSAPLAGAVYMFARTGTGWSQEAYVKASNAQTDAFFGATVSMSIDGSTLAVGAFGEASNATGVGGNQLDRSASAAGAVYVFTGVGAAWTQQAYVKASNTDAGDGFGGAIALSGDGHTLVVGALDESSAAVGVDGNQADNSLQDSGAAYVFAHVNGAWSQTAYLKASNTRVDRLFGSEVAVSEHGEIAAVSAPMEGSLATGINGDESEPFASAAGAVYVFASAGGWKQQAYVKASNTAEGARFGDDVALSGDGATLVVCASGEASGSTGLDGDQQLPTAQASGAAYTFGRSGATWSQHHFIKSSNSEFDDEFCTTGLSADGATLAVGAKLEDSAATGVGGNQQDNSAKDSGAVYVFH
jgi:hypothetical protein